VPLASSIQKQGRRLVSDLSPTNLMIDPPSGWMYGFPKIIPKEHQHRTLEWLIEQGYPKELTEMKHFYCRYWNAG
jgi:hypothetical protein